MPNKKECGSQPHPCFFIRNLLTAIDQHRFDTFVVRAGGFDPGHAPRLTGSDNSEDMDCMDGAIPNGDQPAASDFASMAREEKRRRRRVRATTATDTIRLMVFGSGMAEGPPLLELLLDEEVFPSSVMSST